MYKITILEDEQSQLDKLLGVLSRYRKENPSFEYSVDTYDRGINLLTSYKQDADILFLDIKVPDMLGMDVAKKIRLRDENVMIIFVTNLTQYAVEGYSVNAFDYILKPLQYASFSAKLSRALKTLSYRNPGVVSVQITLLMLRAQDMIFCSIWGRKLYGSGVHLANMSFYWKRPSLQDVMQVSL